jgi:uncharacterized protein
LVRNWHRVGINKQAHIKNKVGADKKDDPDEVAKQGFEALMAGKDEIIAGSLKTKLQAMVSKVLPETVNAELHRSLSEPGSASK